MTDIIDGTAYMMLVTCNAQEELSALERGMHALRSGMDVKACGSTVTASAISPRSSAGNIRRSRVLSNQPSSGGLMQIRQTRKMHHHPTPASTSMYGNSRTADQDAGLMRNFPQMREITQTHPTPVSTSMCRRCN